MRQQKNAPTYECIIDVYYMPFPSDEKRREAYYTQAKLFLRSKEREFKQMYSKQSNKESGLNEALSSSLYSK
jgi:hypothetical protein